MKLAIMLPTYFEEMIGGSEYQSYLLAKAASEVGHEVHYVFTAKQDQYENPLGIHLHPIPRRTISRRFGRTWWLYSPSIRRILKEIQPDAIYVRSGVAWAGTAARYAKQNGCRSVWHVASSADVIPRPVRSLLIRPLEIIEERAIEYAIKHSTHVVAQAQFQADLLMGHYGRLAEVIMNKQPEPTEDIDKNGPFTIIWVANIKPLKQPEMFIRLAREFAGNAEVRFVIIGRPSRGKYQEGLDAEMADLANLTYLREQPIEEVNRILARAHVFVNTSTYEGLPNTFVQSWMREVPVVSMLLDPDNLLTTRRIGFFSGSFARMVRDVRTLVENPALRDEMGRRAREYALGHHSLKKNMGRLLDLIFGENGRECEASSLARTGVAPA
jgi:glycosyltransferase involved in cell wall biosynthesis